MISKEDLDYLKQLDVLRVEARVLRDKGLEAIVAFSIEDDAHWEQEISDNEKLLFRRAKHLAWNLGKIEEYDCESIDVQYFSKEFKRPRSRPQKYHPRVNYPDWPVIVLPVLKTTDITDIVSLCGKLKDSSDCLSEYLRKQLTSISDVLEENKPSTTPSVVLQKAFVKELNNVLTSPSLQDYALKANVKLRPVTKNLLAKGPQGAELLRLNRMLLGDAYPDEITRGCESTELFEARGELREFDIKDMAGLCSKLKDGTNPLSNYLLSGFTTTTLEALQKYTASTSPSEFLIKQLLREFKKALSDPSLKEYALQTGAKLGPVTNSLLAENPQGEDLRRLNRMLLGDAYPDEIKMATESVELFEMPGEPAPILFAANFLRTRLGNLKGCLDEGTLSCYYRVIRELYNLHNTNWALGAARPGEHTGKPSVFITTECARAIGFFARLMENTAHFLKRIHETKEYVEHVKCAQNHNDPLLPPLNSAWCESELRWCTASVKTTIESFRDYVAILLPDLKEVSRIDELLGLIEESVKYFADHSEESFRTVIQWSNFLREREKSQFYKWRRKERKNNREERKNNREAVLFRVFPESELTETAHLIALDALAAARQDFVSLQATFRREKRHAKSSPATNSKVLLEAAAIFANLAKWLRVHLDPSKEYFEKNLHRCLAENARGGNPNLVQDLALSALSLGLITKDWYRPDCRQALEILCENLDESGRFPVAPPFGYNVKGEGRVVINAQIIRAFAQLLQHFPSNLSSELKARIPNAIKRMLGYFQSQSIQMKPGIAWPSLRALNQECSSLWVSSISVLALHRIVLMLNALINYGVKEHFHTKTASELKEEGVPYLHELMCSDVGYVSVGNESRRLTRVVMELEGMRAHLLGSGRANKVLHTKEALGDLPLRSLILYGPPGTGKTTLVKSLAVTSNVDLVEVMSHDLYGPGTERVMEQASYVMDALKLLTSTAILFDEFEPILHPRPEHPVRITEMLTGNMLPKLDALYKAAGRNGIAYVLSTNYVERLDSAAIRAGRFDRLRFIYYPDAASRVCRLVSELRHLMKRFEAAGVSVPAPSRESVRRLMEVVAKTARRSVSDLCCTGWFVAPREIKTVPASYTGSSAKLIAPQTEDKLSPVWQYIIWNKSSDEIDWDLFGSAEKMIDPNNDASNIGKKSTDKERAIMNLVRAWDDELRNVVRYRPQASWEDLIDLLSKPIDSGKHGSEPSSSVVETYVDSDGVPKPERRVSHRRSGVDRRSQFIASHPYFRPNKRLGVERRRLADRRVQA